MPPPKTKRTIILQAGYSHSDPIADLGVTMDATFTHVNSVRPANLLQDLSTTGNETSRYKISFSLSGATFAELTLSLAAHGDNLASGVSMTKTSATTTTTPMATATTVTRLPSPGAHFTRTWQQNALNAGTTLVKQVAYLDVRVTAASGYSVTQTLTSAATNALVLTYSWMDINGVAQVSGTVKLDPLATPSGIYTLGTATVTDAY